MEERIRSYELLYGEEVLVHQLERPVGGNGGGEIAEAVGVLGGDEK